jgi:hypothetical protein
MTLFGWRTGRCIAVVCLTGVLAMATAAPALAADKESREFTVTIDGRDSGHYRMTIERRDDGTVRMVSQASIQVKRLALVVYRYNFNCTEVWKDGKDAQLLTLTSACDDNGTKYDVSAAAETTGLRVRVNGQPRLVRADVWTTTYWKLADARFHNQAVPLLDADTGKDFTGRLTYLGTEQITTSGQAQNCYHFRVVGGPNPVELWYDAQHRLARHEFTEDGHRTIIQLTAVRR